MKLRFFFLCLLALFFPGFASSDSWSTWLVPPSKSAQAVSILEEAHYFCLSWSSATVPLGEFDRLIEVPVSTLEERLLPKDPRWDPFLKELKSWWDTPQGEKLFVQSDNIAQISKLLKGLASPLISQNQREPSKKSENPFLFWLLNVALFGGFFVFWLRRIPQVRWKAQLGKFALYSTLCFLTGTFSAPAGLAGGLFLRQFEEFKPHKPFKFLQFIGILFLLSVINWLWFALGENKFQDFSSALSLALIGIMLEGTRILWLRRRETQRLKAEHPWFQAIPLKFPHPASKKQSLFPLLGIVGGFFFETVLWSISGSHFLAASPVNDAFWQHCWYQQAVTVGLTWQDYPKPLVLKNYHLQEGNLVEQDQILMEPNEAWRQLIERELSPTDIGRVLAKTP